MQFSIRQLGLLVRAARSDAGFTSQEQFASACGPAVSRTAVALLEQGRRLPSALALQLICDRLHVPRSIWQPLLDPEVVKRLEFEDVLSELVGSEVGLSRCDPQTITVAHHAVMELLGTGLSRALLHDAFCAAMVFYGVQTPSHQFIERYLSPAAFRTVETFRLAIQQYQRDAIRLFASFSSAYSTLSQAPDLSAFLMPLAPRNDERYRSRTEWNIIEQIPEARLPDLGYISAARVHRDHAERQYVSAALASLADDIASSDRVTALARISDRKRRKIDSLLRKFESVLRHDLMSPLFGADADAIRREAKRLAPKDDEDLSAMARTQETGQRNLSRYLAADHLDVYVATSMRSDADFVSVNSFVNGLFAHDEVSPLKLRYFNPTQSWIEDRVAKGLVEALMLKRSDFTIYMAQKTDTFGKDSEASVALGQGKPVIVYVPKLSVPDVDIDSEKLALAGRSELQQIVKREAKGDDADVDDITDEQALLAQVLSLRLETASDPVLADAVRRHWADFDLYGEADRIADEKTRASYRSWLDEVIRSKAPQSIDASIRTQTISVLVGTATNFEKRATVFREVHPLALQVILSTGVLNGILVARSIDVCAVLLARLARNELELELRTDDDNYRLIERSTLSTVRVISRHQLVTNAFSAFYNRGA